MAIDRSETSPQIPDNRVLEAIFVLINCPSAQEISLESAFSILQEAASTDQIVVEHSPDGWPCGFAVWQTTATKGQVSVELQWFVAVSGFRVSFMRALRHVHFADRGIDQYTRLNDLGNVVVREWTNRRLGGQSRADEGHTWSTLEECWFEVWGVDRWPGRIEGEAESMAIALRRFRRDLISHVSPMPGERFVVTGSKSGRLAYELLEHDSVQVLDVHSEAHTMDRAAALCKERANAQHFHGTIERVVGKHSSFDGVLAVCLSHSVEDLRRSIRALSQLLRVGGRAVIADYSSTVSGAAKLQSTSTSIPSTSDWSSLFERVGFDVHHYEDFSEDAASTFLKIASTIGGSDRSEIAVDAKSRLILDAEAVRAGRTSWGVWTVNKTKCVDSLPFASHQARTLVMLSGGIDSVYTLWDVLANSTHEVIAHHVHFLNAEMRVTPEARACKNIVRWLQQNVRPLTYSETTLDRQNLRFFGHDMVAIGFEAGLAAQNYRYNHDVAVDYWRVGSCLEEGGWSSRWPHVLSCCAAASHPFAPPEYLQAPIISKRAQFEAMPRALSAMTWGCRRPVWNANIAMPCGECLTCRERRDLGLS